MSKHYTMTRSPLPSRTRILDYEEIVEDNFVDLENEPAKTSNLIEHDRVKHNTLHQQLGKVIRVNPRYNHIIRVSYKRATDNDPTEEVRIVRCDADGK